MPRGHELEKKPQLVEVPGLGQPHGHGANLTAI
jgi:hypothetical protein